MVQIKSNIHLAFLILILLLAASLRIVKLGEIPPSVISDEASIGYNAFSIFKTGNDEWGNKLPISFPAFGDNKLPGYIYATVPSVAVFGLNEFSTRLPSAIFGILTVLTCYLLVLELFKDKKIALISSLLVSISPWSIYVSRMAIEANMAVFFTSLGLLFFLKSLHTPKFLTISLILFSLTFYIYNSNRVFVPILLILLIIIFRKIFQKDKKNFAIALILSFILLLPVAKYFIAQSWTGRLSKVAVFTDSGMAYRVNEEREYCTRSFPKLPCYIASNKLIKIIDTIFKNYLSHYSVKFLFLSGPENLIHYSMPNYGELHIFELPFLILGLFFLLIKKSRARLIIFPWLLVFPIASSLTSTAHPIRALVALPVFEIIIAVGIVYVFREIKIRLLRYLLFVLMIGFALLNLNEFIFTYFKVYSKQSSEAFQYGYKELFSELKKSEDNYSKVIITKKYGEPHIFYLFYEKIDPNWYQKSPDVKRTERSDKWKEVNKIGKYYFTDFTKETPKPEPNTVFALGPNESNELLTIGKTLFYLNGKQVLHIAK